MRTLLVALLLGVSGCRTIDDSLGSPVQTALGTNRPLTFKESVHHHPPPIHPVWTKEAWTLTRLPATVETNRVSAAERPRSQHGAQTDPPLPPS